MSILKYALEFGYPIWVCNIEEEVYYFQAQI